MPENVSISVLNAGNPFGVLEFLHWDYPWSNYKYAQKDDIRRAVRLMKEAGIGWVRMDFLWEDIEPRHGEFQFVKYDFLVNLLAENGIQVLGLLDYCAPWANAQNQWNYPPRENQLFVDYALTVIARYKDQVKYWEVWNEPDSNIYWAAQDGLKSYCALLKGVYAAAKKIDPDCKILNGGLANGIASVNQLYDNGAKDCFDILNIHIFESPLDAVAIKRVLAYPKLAYKIMRRNGDTAKKIWVTEIGCPGMMLGIETKNWWIGGNPSEEQQAEWAREVFSKLIKQEAIEKVFWAFFRDCKGHWNNGTDYFGLVRWDFSKKPAFFSYKRCVENWRASKLKK
ncbi:MAG: family 1 glycosylhydrolase [Candidatus Omnitrophica bacterium]|nr:family 1 glycosylhydrolase [Candidatus Omnitrophota bacterium]MDD5592979.1 family 1 glycosylhydrolase [Candidatus Omnitrophota bacterium]